MREPAPDARPPASSPSGRPPHTWSRGGALLSLSLFGLALLTGQAETPTGPHAARFQHHAVAADQGLASRAGAEILAAGGNAADAAAATMLALGVVSPGSSGLGGGGFALYYRASDDSLSFVDFRETAPAASTPEMFADPPENAPRGSKPSQYGGLATGVPGEPAGIEALLERFGSGEVSRAEVAAPAIRYAEDGFTVPPYLARLSGYFQGQMKQDPVMRRWFEDGADAFRPGQVLRNPTLAQTLRRFGREGARPFYRGSIAAEIVRANRAAGGRMTRADLAGYQVAFREPLEGRRLGHRIATAPPPSAGGYTILASLAQLERWIPERQRRIGGAPWLHAVAESFKAPFWDRSAYFGDPDQVEVPLDRLLAEDRLTAMAKDFHPTLAIPAAGHRHPLPGLPAGTVDPREGQGTSHLCVMDAEGNVAAVTTTVNLPFGARYTAAGIVMNDEMDDFASEIGERNAFSLPGGAPNLPGPGKRPVSSMSPTIVFGDDGAPVLCVGASGGSRIITAITQTIWNVLARQLTVEDVLQEPRIHHQGIPDVLRTEELRPLPPEVRRELIARGHTLEESRNVAVIQLLHRDPAGGIAAGSDPAKGGVPAGD